MAQLKPPPPDSTRPAPKPQFYFPQPGTRFIRIFDADSHNTGPLTFRYHGPLARFDHQRGQAPEYDSERGIYYVAKTLSSCVVEVFGDTGIIENIESQDFHVARVTTRSRLRLLDLRKKGAMRAGTIAAVCSDSERPLSQAWSRYFYDTPDYKNCDGLIYSNAHNGEDAIALYERAAPKLAFDPQDVVALGDSRLRPQLLKIAENHHLLCPP